MNQEFARSKEIADSIEGMLTPFSMAVMDSLLEFQQQRGIGGDIIEMGVYRGKSAAMLGRRTASGELLHLYDVEDHPDRDDLSRTGATVLFNLRDLSRVSRRSFRKQKKTIRFCHIDASHRFDPTMHELALADYVLSNDGIVCLDDYANLNYSQILAATFKYLYTKHTNLTPFLVTTEKAYLCRKGVFRLYANFVLDELGARMADRGVPEICVARTDVSRSYQAFHVRERAPGETELYGPSIYANFYDLRRASFTERVRFFSRKFYDALRPARS